MRLEEIISGSLFAPPLPEVVDACVELRSWCVRNGRGLGEKTHEADRWVAASQSLLASEDTVFDDIDRLRLVKP